MKKLLYLLPLILLISCNKKKTEPKENSSVTPAPTKVWCFYQTTNGTKFWVDCAKNQAEFNTKSQTYNPATTGMNYSYTIKTSCDSCF